MHADREDAPVRARTRSNRNLPLFIGLGLGVLVSAGALLLGSNSYRTLQPAQPGPITPAAEKLPAPQELPAPINPVAVSTETPAVLAAPAHVEPARPRQNSFNAQNTQPRGAINIIPATRPEPRPRPARTETAEQAPSIRHQSYWRWERQSGNFLWVEKGDNIDWASVCSNYQRGSLIYRDCRKAARVTFADLCRRNTRSPACAAASQYNPL